METPICNKTRPIHVILAVFSMMIVTGSTKRTFSKKTSAFSAKTISLSLEAVKLTLRK